MWIVWGVLTLQASKLHEEFKKRPSRKAGECEYVVGATGAVG